VNDYSASPSSRSLDREALFAELIGRLAANDRSEPRVIIEEFADADRAYYVTEFECATFLSGIGAGILTPKRRSISGIIVCNLGVSGQQMLGVLHPDPVRPFSAELLPGVDFCTLAADLPKA